MVEIQNFHGTEYVEEDDDRRGTIDFTVMAMGNDLSETFDTLHDAMGFIAIYERENGTEDYEELFVSWTRYETPEPEIMKQIFLNDE